ncbi:hypothetical protein FRC03_002672 [Tulasnella sp. 419]|nr:hypothetical protein FRC03_002672 [Tulasnella sp. 419]
MAFNAADLQRRHELEGAPDPFPSLNDSPARPSKNNASSSKNKNLDTSEEAFPSLGGSAPSTPKVASAWGTGPRIQRQVEKKPVFTESFSLSSLDLRTAGRDGKPTTLREVMTKVMNQSRTTVEASTQRMGNQTTFVIKGDSETDLEYAKKLLTSLLSPTVTRKVEAPVSTIGGIIGTKGANLKQIRDQTGVKVDIPRKDENLAVPNGGVASASRSPSPGAVPDEDEEEPTVSISVTGPAPSVQEAISMIQAIIGHRTAKTTQRFKDAPRQCFPFLNHRIHEFEQKVYEQFPEASINIVAHENKEFVVSGNKEAVLVTIENLKAASAELEDSLNKVAITIPRAQHRFVTSEASLNEFMDTHGITILSSEDSEALDIWGPPAKLGPALGVVLEKSNSQHVKSIPLPQPSAPVLAYIKQTGYVDTISWSNADLEIGLTEKPKASVDIVGDKKKVEPIAKEVIAYLKKLEGGVKVVAADWKAHKAIQARNTDAISQFNEKNHVLVYFPEEYAEDSSILLVFDPETATKPNEKKKHLDTVASEISNMVKAIGEVVTVEVPVEKKWHAAVAGKYDAKLEAIIGEDRLISVKAGPGDHFTAQGPKSEVDRAVAELEKAIVDAKNYEAEHSYVTEFIIQQDYVGRIVGSGGAAVNKLREEFDVKIDFQDSSEDQEFVEKGKKKKAPSGAKSKVRIQGRQQDAEEAKKRILSTVDKLADETTEVVKIPHQYHFALIGSGGKYAKRLEEKYVVKITFPKGDQEHGEYSSNKNRENLKADEVLIKGGKKGVALAKSELLEVVEYEKSHNHTMTFTIPSRAVARVVGKGGANINEIKENTNVAGIDVEKEESTPGLTTITVRGTVAACKEAKAAVLEVTGQVEEEVEETLTIENKYHRNFIGKGGETLREILSKVGAPTDPKAQAGLIHFPRADEPADEVRLRGSKSLVNKLKAELEQLAATYRDRVVIGVGVPAAQHRTLIGRGGQHLNDLQTKTGTQIWFPGSRAYGSVDEPENADELQDVVPEDIVKVFGPRAACQAAIAELTKVHASSQRQPRTAPQESITREITVPLKYHHVINQQGNFYRTIRSYGVFVEQSKIPETPFVPVRPPPASNGSASAARIDQDEEDESTPASEWQVIPNYEGAEEGDAVWTLRSKDEAALDSAEKILRDAIEHAEGASHVGFLTLSDRSVFPRIVGSKGANVQRLRAETGADITVGREDNTIIIIGSMDALEAAKEAIHQTISAPKNGRGRRND